MPVGDERIAGEEIVFERVVPVERIELPTFGLQNRCTTAVLHRLTTRVLRYQHAASDASSIER
jgi:hypothetical protein